MVNLDWGTKRACLSCSAKFYDLKRSPIVCPKCGEIFEIQAPTGRRRKSAASDDKLIDAVLADDLLGVNLELPEVDGDLDDELIEDTSDLGEDLDDIPDVMGDEHEH